MRLMIVDDEKNTRNVLRHFIPWDTLEIEEILEAKDGREALAAARSFQPDLVLSDIRMPRMTGLEFAQEYRKENENCRFIFLSAYSDRDYLKQAIRLRAVRYVEKPIQIEEVKEAVAEALEEIHQTRLQTGSHREMMLKKTVLDLALGRIREGEPAPLDHPFFSPGLYTYACAYIRTFPVDDTNGPDYTTEELREAFRLLLSEYADLTKKEPDDGDFFEERLIAALKDPEHILCHARLDGGFSYRDFLRLLSYVSGHLRNRFPRIRRVLIGAGDSVASPKKLPGSYERARKARKRAFFSGGLSVYDEDIRVYDFSSPLAKKSLQLLRQEEEGVTLSHLRQLKKDLLPFEDTPEESLRRFYGQLFLALSQRAQSHNKTLFMEMSGAYMSALAEACCLEEINSCMEDAVRFFFMSKTISSSPSGIAQKVTDYILRDFASEDLSISKIASGLYLSPNYLSLVFKQETEKTINQFITETRMEKAKELLKNEKLTLSAVSLRVGYHDANYFSKAFKRETGLTPKAFREGL